ncbi:hypothetical protein BGZ82_000023 [Podila clonocystis]|nr:hypothetical protein BGZ82_000023 [Podila clonocystis]
MKLAPLATVLCLVAVARTAVVVDRSEDFKANAVGSIANQGLRHHEIKGSEPSRHHASGVIRRADDKKEGKKEEKKDDKKDVDKLKGDDKKKGTPAAPASGYASPLWMVQPYSASVWEQGRDYVISWGPNPDPVHSKDLQDHAPVDVRLMQGPPDLLKEVFVIQQATDSSTHSFTWTIPANLAPATDYTIRLSHEGSVDTYSHFFEVSKVGDPRSTKSNVGEPLVMPQLGAVPFPEKPKGAKPASPPNPIPADKAATHPDGKTPASKPATHASSSVETRSANVLGFAMALFGAVYFL